ncbi:MAG: hypothetical protein Q9196_002017 [Gyalolechia fulgens]
MTNRTSHCGNAGGKKTLCLRSLSDDLPSRRDRQSVVTDQIHQHFQRLDARRDVKPRAINARDAAAVPNPTPKPPGKSTSDSVLASRAPVDARNLGVQRSSNGPRIIRTSAGQRDERPSNGPRITRASAGQRDERPSNGPRIIRTRAGQRDERPSNGPRITRASTGQRDERPSDGPRITRASAGQPEDRGPRMRPRSDASDKQHEGGASNTQQNRKRGPPSQSRPPRTKAGGAKERRGAVRPSGNDDSADSRNSKEELSSEEITYLETRDDISDYNDTIFAGRAAGHTRANQYKTYTPTEISVDSLQGMGPALACGERGMSETVGERMIQVNKDQAAYDERISELARKWAEGEFCHFRSKRERDHTTKTVERNLAGVGDNAKRDEGKEKEQMGLMDTRMEEEVGKLATRLLRGEYSIGPLGKGPTAELLERYTTKKETYLPKDRQSLAGQISTLLPLKAAPSTASPAARRTNRSVR